MSIWTSSFARAGRLPDAVSIARGEPRGWQGKKYKLLAPEWSWVKNIKEGFWSQDEYMEAYYGLLQKLDPEQVIQDLGDGAIMLCWCNAPKDFCHRTMVAKWLEVEANLIVPEWSEAGQMSFDFAG
jgi:hypothetical protein